jgi:hypothetical protein
MNTLSKIAPRLKCLLLMLHAMHSFCLQRASFLNPREQQFINDLCRWRGALTSKQRSWLEAINDRLHAA